MPDSEFALRSAYRAFNARDVEAAVELMHPEVDCPNACEGGRVVGRGAVRDYWHFMGEQYSRPPGRSYATRLSLSAGSDSNDRLLSCQPVVLDDPSVARREDRASGQKPAAGHVHRVVELTGAAR
jgi:hypothetical protein